jgi:hypothetical protein
MGKSEKSVPIEKAPTWIWWILGVIAVATLLAILTGGSSDKEGAKETTPESQGVSSKPAYPAISLKYPDTLRIFPGEKVCLALDSATSGLVVFPNLVTIQFEPTGPFQLLRKGQSPLTGYPGLQDLKWDVIPNEVRFRALGEKDTLLITTKGE